MRSSRANMAKIRAVLLAVLLCGQGILSVPLPLAVVRPNSPESSSELSNWRNQLEQVGITVTKDELVGWVKQWSQLARWRRELLLPLRPVQDLFGTGQEWGFFAVPVTHPRRLEVYLLDDEGESLLYRRLDPDHTWRAAWFSDRRVRGVYDSVRGRKPVYQRFVQTVSSDALQTFPEANGVRVQLVRTQTLLPSDEDPMVVPKILMKRTVWREDNP